MEEKKFYCYVCYVYRDTRGNTFLGFLICCFFVFVMLKPDSVEVKAERDRNHAVVAAPYSSLYVRDSGEYAKNLSAGVYTVNTGKGVRCDDNRVNCYSITESQVAEFCQMFDGINTVDSQLQLHGIVHHGSAEVTLSGRQFEETDRIYTITSIERTLADTECVVRVGIKHKNELYKLNLQVGNWTVTPEGKLVPRTMSVSYPYLDKYLPPSWKI